MMVDQPERRLKEAIERDREQLLVFLNGPVEHAWEDRLYRFYHQSHKVFRLQKLTREIVAKLQALLPENHLNSWFQEIVEAGTTQEFGSHTNEHWTMETRPIVEAFCHAKYFLEMACKEQDDWTSELPSPVGPVKREIRMVSSGWAALLALFNIH
jgi:hypothetical protein